MFTTRYIHWEKIVILTIILFSIIFLEGNSQNICNCDAINIFSDSCFVTNDLSSLVADEDRTSCEYASIAYNCLKSSEDIDEYKKFFLLKDIASYFYVVNDLDSASIVMNYIDSISNNFDELYGWKWDLLYLKSKILCKRGNFEDIINLPLEFSSIIEDKHVYHKTHYKFSIIKAQAFIELRKYDSAMNILLPYMDKYGYEVEREVFKILIRTINKKELINHIEIQSNKIKLNYKDISISIHFQNINRMYKQFQEEKTSNKEYLYQSLIKYYRIEI